MRTKLMMVSIAAVLGAISASTVSARTGQATVPGTNGQRETVIPLPPGERRNQAGSLEIREPRPVSALMVNGRPAGGDVDPQMIGGRMMVPIRFVSEQLGANVTWDPATKTVRLLQGNQEVTMTIGSTRAFVNSLARALVEAPVIREGRTLLPLRDVARLTGSTADYNPDTRTVFVTTPGGRGSRSGTGGGGRAR